MTGVCAQPDSSYRDVRRNASQKITELSVSSPDECEVFRNDLARAREQQAEVWADEIVSISDAELPGEPGSGCRRVNGSQVPLRLSKKYDRIFSD